MDNFPLNGHDEYWENLSNHYTNILAMAKDLKERQLRGDLGLDLAIIAQIRREFEYMDDAYAFFKKVREHDILHTT